MIIEILETRLISSSPSSLQFDPLPLSHLDNDANLRIPFRTLRAFAGGPSHSTADPSTTIATALSKALTFYRPLAASLRSDPSNFRLHSHLSSPAEVALVIASASDPLHALLSLFDAEPGSPILDRLAPDANPDEALARPLALQITRFACGGFALGMCVHHALCDGAGASQFLAAIGRLARGSDQPGVDPVWDRSILLGPRSPPRIELPLHNLLGFDGKGRAYDDEGVGRVKECFHVSTARLDRFRSGLANAAGSSFTSFEALGAYIWRARIKAKKLDGREVVKFVYSMSIKKIAIPQLPSGYWGNSCVPVYIQSTAKELLEKPVWQIAMEIKKSKEQVTNEYLRSFIDFQELHYRKGITAGKEVSAFTDWRHLGHSEVDFGWGSPIAVSPLSWRLLGSNEPSFLLPYAESEGEKRDGFRVLVCLPEDAMASFRLEMEIFGVGDVCL
ncbi:hypothetical protein IEQ34_004433 [Dendrobium chrysotoxum]|uniref:Uncharacterized protein n=1 Tax=Dendrobium chrysotoxum TaxID=161865 RepID=A0AAV7HIB5_DENCH|nr:hypothetical protein IEQ34_004433 [Dendrobium chrysotoxum]